MMSIAKTKELKDEISFLPIDQRLEIADYVLETLNQPDPEIEKAWMKEVDRRAAQVDSGEAELIPAQEVFKGLKEITGR